MTKIKVNKRMGYKVYTYTKELKRSFDHRSFKSIKWPTRQLS